MLVYPKFTLRSRRCNTTPLHSSYEPSCHQRTVGWTGTDRACVYEGEHVPPPPLKNPSTTLRTVSKVEPFVDIDRTLNPPSFYLISRTLTNTFNSKCRSGALKSNLP